MDVTRTETHTPQKEIWRCIMCPEGAQCDNVTTAAPSSRKFWQCPFAYVSLENVTSAKVLGPNPKWVYQSKSYRTTTQVSCPMNKPIECIPNHISDTQLNQSESDEYDNHRQQVSFPCDFDGISQHSPSHEPNRKTRFLNQTTSFSYCHHFKEPHRTKEP